MIEQFTARQLTERQQRERDFYREYSHLHKETQVDFDPVLGLEQRPWNPYWRHYQVVRDFYAHPRQRLLDFGCGTGTASMCYAKIGYQVTGFDICEENIAECYHNAERHGFRDRTDFSIQAAESLDYPSESFDIVAGIDILHHVEIDASIREARRVLKPGGIAVFREFVEAPIFDRLRESWLVTRVFPKAMSLDEHRTHDERKLSSRDLGVIRSVFADCEIARFNLLYRFRKLWTNAPPTRVSTAEKIDQWIFAAFPFLRPFGGDVVMVLRKESRGS
jgi:2-polyprenyl-3-methyl-5-hydroxy-6-metoxy-1,4-benzoquinol methylase